MTENWLIQRLFLNLKEENGIYSKLKVHLKGEADKKAQFRYLIILFSIYYALYLITYLIYPNPPGYSMFMNFVSDLGNIKLNPGGWLIFSIAEFIMGFFYIAQINYFYKHLRGDCKVVNNIAVTFAFVGTAGTLMLAFFPEDFDNNTMHIIGTFLTFGGTYISLFFNMLILIGKRRLGREWPVSNNFILNYVMVFLVGGIYVFRIQLQMIFIPMGFPTYLFSSHFWEWMCLFSVNLWIFILHNMIPEDKEKLNLV